jgi:hypothetical protein
MTEVQKEERDAANVSVVGLIACRAHPVQNPVGADVVRFLVPEDALFEVVDELVWPVDLEELDEALEVLPEGL